MATGEKKGVDPGREGPDGEESAGSPGRLRVLLVAGGGLALGALTGAFVVAPAAGGSPEHGGEPAADPHASGEKHEHLIENLIVNPSGTKGSRLLLATVAVVVDSEKSVAELEERDAEVRDRLFAVLAAKTVEELTDLGARASLKEELREVVAEITHGNVLDIHLPQWVVQ